MRQPTQRRSRRLAACAVAATLLLTACSSGEDDQASSPTATSDSPSDSPQESSTPSPERTGAPEVSGVVAEEREVPWGITFLRDGSALVTERDTWRILHLTPRGGGDRWRTRDLGVLDVAPGAGPSVEGGLLGIATAPGPGQAERVFVYVTTTEDNRVLTTTFDGEELGRWRPVLTGIPRADYHDGGRIAVGPDGHLYVSTGDAGQPELAQDPDSLAGKILRMRLNGRPAPGNPERGSLVWSSGHRNVQGLAWDDDDQLWASEFGERSWDELNRIEPGANYGWPEVEGRSSDDPGADGEGFTEPVAVWPTDQASPSGLAWAAGRLWLGALRGTRLWEVDVSGDEARSTPHFVGEYGRLRTVVATPEGDLWMTTSNRDGRGQPAEEDDRILLLTWSD